MSEPVSKMNPLTIGKKCVRSIESYRLRFAKKFVPLQNAYKASLILIDPENNSFPRSSTILWSTLCFVVFLVFGGFAIGYPKSWMRIVVVVVNSTIFVLLMALAGYDAWRLGNRAYRRNLACTILVFLLTVVTMTILYEMVWYKSMNLWILQSRQERLPSFRFPPMFIIQDKAHYQAHILDEQPWTCYVGAQNRTAPMCNTLTKDQVLETESCNCNDSWVHEVLPNFLDGDGGDGKRSLSLLPKENLYTRANVMTVKFAFNYNTTANTDPQLGSPNLWMFVYDSTISVGDAYMNGYSSMRLFNAHGASTVLLNNKYFEARDGTSRYEFGAVIWTTPYMNLVCDVSGNQTYYPCSSTLLLNVPGFDSTIMTEKRAMAWTDTVGQAGAYFALVQVVSWMISGVAWGT
ncbi:hypothetical protein BKA65DRAFT_549650 [Rhexocercosporidium sp. MPI-PUGE-AT-0058]|nr:hypothetical protein BKA65DRAFT_549650 [Rhexocercosporidium sp. MPI-PUGE-AT-0058]